MKNWKIGARPGIGFLVLIAMLPPRNRRAWITMPETGKNFKLR
jgi:hypothetical protein